jgi:UDPglucose--hexose-1-phosphate uridylyltransferase
MAPRDAEEVLATWQREHFDLGGRPEVDHVLIFENKGSAVGVSNPHPHGQIYATNFVFKTIENEATVSERHLRETGRVLFQDVLDAETEDGRRILYENETAIAFVPYFARYAYEVFVAPKRTHPSVASLSGNEIVDFTAALQQVLTKYDNLWRMSFPYVMPLHQAPTDGSEYRGFHFHVELHPPLRKPNLLKYLAGPEIGGSFSRHRSLRKAREPRRSPTFTISCPGRREARISRAHSASSRADRDSSSNASKLGSRGDAEVANREATRSTPSIA